MVFTLEAFQEIIAGITLGHDVCVINGKTFALIQKEVYEKTLKDLFKKN
jgi:hypothetical protein